jgi:hypothetical protein
MAEEWKICFENYEISNLGNCRKLLNDGTYKTIKGSTLNRGYRYFQVQRDGMRVNKLFHEMVAMAFIGPRPENLVIDHIDRDKLNNKVENLRYVSHTENCRNCHRYRTDIETTDPVERKRVFQREHDIRTGHTRNIRRKRGTGTVQERNNKFRAIIVENGVIRSKTCETREEALEFLKGLSKK